MTFAGPSDEPAPPVAPPTATPNRWDLSHLSPSRAVAAMNSRRQLRTGNPRRIGPIELKDPPGSPMSRSTLTPHSTTAFESEVAASPHRDEVEGGKMSSYWGLRGSAYAHFTDEAHELSAVPEPPSTTAPARRMVVLTRYSPRDESSARSGRSQGGSARASSPTAASPAHQRTFNSSASSEERILTLRVRAHAARGVG